VPDASVRLRRFHVFAIRTTVASAATASERRNRSPTSIRVNRPTGTRSGAACRYGGPVRNDPDVREPRLPAVAIWMVTGLLMGLALGIVTGALLVAIVVGGLLGLSWGFFTTRDRRRPMDDD
jgi:hypothetical protein